MTAMQLLSSQPWVTQLGWALIHFLWQGVLIAAVFAIARRSRDAQTRYLLACAALAAMVAAPAITFMLTVANGSVSAHPFTANVILALDPAGAILAVNEASSAPAVAAWNARVMPWLVTAWLAGAILFWARLTGAWIVAARMKSTRVHPAPAEWQRTLNQIGVRIRVSRPVRLLVSGLIQVPTVVGWLRPVVLVPVGALTGLPAEHIEALLVHELAHIRRHDYLVNILQSVAEALLFYHPAIWWISNQVRNERELCCDDIAVSVSGDALTYARALAGLEAHRPAHLNPSIAANGGELRNRVARLLGASHSGPHTLPGFGLLLCGILIAFAAFGLLAQPALGPPAFEVASVKPEPWKGEGGMYTVVRGNTVTSEHEDLYDLVKFAYGLSRDVQLSGGPAWAAHGVLDSSALFQVIAKAAGDSPPDVDRFRLMMQNLLRDRFQLKVHRVSKELPVYELVVAKNGPKLRGSAEATPFALNIVSGIPTRIRATHTPLAKIIFYIETSAGRPVIDKTGLTGLYDFDMEWAGEPGDTGGQSIFTAVQERLGLKLEKGTAPFDTVVIDRAAKPSEN